MRLGKAHIKNFQSYRDQEFDYSGLGLALVSGPTGSGKSTLLDVPCWILYGVNSKDSAADDIKCWFGEGVTSGTLEVHLNDGSAINVTRIRGKSYENDLYWTERGSDKQHRGKDMKDTQAQLERRLGTSTELYLLGSYLHQFSQSEAFFMANAKDRRKTMEKLADLSVPVQLSERASEARKMYKKELEEKMLDRASLYGQAESSRKNQESLLRSRQEWNLKTVAKIAELHAKAAGFEDERKAKLNKLLDELEALDKLIVDPAEFDRRKEQWKTQLDGIAKSKADYKTESEKLNNLRADLRVAQSELDRLVKFQDEGGDCPTCYAPADKNANLHCKVEDLTLKVSTLRQDVKDGQVKVDVLEKAISVEARLHAAYDKIRDDKAKNDQYVRDFETRQAQAIAMRDAANTFGDQAEALSKEVNPFDGQIQKSIELIDDLRCQLEQADRDVAELEHLITSLTWLYERSFEIRACMLEQAKNEVASRTNAFLEKYFDAALRLKLTFDGQDKLEATITNAGHVCPYKQLSGGERDMLRLCFWLSLSKQVENAAGVKFGTLMMDEALKSLDPSIKTKVFNLLQTLETEYDTVLLVDHHEEFKSLFASQFQVTNVNGASAISNE